MTIIQGSADPAAVHIGIVVSQFNEFVTSRLLDGALDCLRNSGVPDSAVDVVRCPGAYELPQAAQHLAATSAYDAIICLGCVIRGETPHFDYVASASATGIQRVALDTGVPIAFGVLTTDTPEQAVARAGGGESNKGWESALSALEMAGLTGKIRTLRPGRSSGGGIKGKRDTTRKSSQP